MDLQEWRSARQRDRYVMRLGCLLVCFALVLTLMLPQQRAYAVEPVTMTVVASLAVAYFGACGLTFITQNMDKDALVSSVQRLLQEFLDTELGGISIQDWLGTVWDVAVLNTKILMGRPLTNELMGFAQWVAQKYAAQAGENLVLSGKSITFPDGTSFEVGTYDESSVVYVEGDYYASSYILGSVIPYSGTSDSGFVRYDVNSSYYFKFYGSSNDSSFLVSLCNSRTDSVFFGVLAVAPKLPGGFSFSMSSSGDLAIGYVRRVDASVYSGFYHLFYLSLPRYSFLHDLLHGSDLSIDRTPSVSYIPEGIEAEQGIALDVGAAPTMDLSQILQQVLEDVLAGTLTSSMEIADAEDVPVDPPAGEITDVDGLGLPALGAALTSRFPFSIPWDFSRAVQLLAAPAKAPYFEVDLLEPIAYRVGGWQGSTKIVLDFSQYEIIGQVTRWTSTIGFCLMLAGATKRLIWTA